ncbi:hypothetical protein [Dysosmobacter sp.]|uniref:hypothetical protein n=1 Tax=Dysosmobacter sp. TaxID=2591382 RepID=UPI003D8BFB3A
MKTENCRETLLWEKMESLVTTWKALAPGDDAVRQHVNLEITETMLALFPKSQDLDALGMFWIQDLGKYDPTLGSFQTFVTARLKLRKADMKYQDSGAHRVTIEENGSKCQRWIGSVSLDSRTDEEEGRTEMDRYMTPQALQDNGEEWLELEDRVGQLIAAILRLPQLLDRQANNEARINYYRMFFTDGMVNLMHSTGEKLDISHERDLFRAMKIPFLDFFLERNCRTVREILGTDLKDYGEMVPGRSMEKPKQPLPNDIYMQYLNDREQMNLKSPSTITNQRNAYRAFFKEVLC